MRRTQLSSILFVVTFIHDDRLVVIGGWVTLAMMMRTVIMAAVMTMTMSVGPVIRLLRADSRPVIGIRYSPLRLRYRIMGIFEVWSMQVPVRVVLRLYVQRSTCD